MSTATVIYVAATADGVADIEAAIEGLDLIPCDAEEIEDRLEDAECVVLVHDPPEIDGLDLLEDIRARRSVLPVVLLDETASTDVASRAVTLDVDGYVSGGADDAATEVATRIDEEVEMYRERRIPIEGLEDPEDFMEAFFTSAPVHLYAKDVEARHAVTTASMADDDDLIGKTDVDLYGEDGEVWYEDDMRVIQDGERLSNVAEQNPDRNQFYLTSKAPLLDEDGEIRGLAGATRNVSDRHRHRLQLERQNDRLKRVASIISHDLRNPLNVVSGRLELAAEEQESEHIDEARAALDRMSALVEDLLQMVRHGQWVEETELVSMESLATETWEFAGGDQANLSIGHEFFFEADEARLRQLLENLFQNALRHGGSDARVHVAPREDWAGFYVEDDGPGIPPDDRESVFESGYTTAEEGTGFGLVIVETIAEAHGWQVEVSEGDLGGARFDFVGVTFE